MNKKGFTLIELIATIALLSIIAIIAFVSINKVIKESKVKNCESLISNLRTAARDYVSDNRYESSFIDSAKNNLSKVDVTEGVIGHNYITTPIIDPVNNVEVTGIVHIYVKLKSNYTVEQVMIDIGSDPNNPEYTQDNWCKR